MLLKKKFLKKYDYHVQRMAIDRITNHTFYFLIFTF